MIIMIQKPELLMFMFKKSFCNYDAHRAASDAEICGMVFLELLPYILKDGSKVTV